MIPDEADGGAATKEADASAGDKNELLTLRNFKRRAAGGKSYWGEGARVLGVIECKSGLRFKNSTTGIASAATASTSVAETKATMDETKVSAAETKALVE